MSLLKSMATVSGFTAMSRVLGLVREILIAKYLGAGAVTDAFVAAFRFPNMFRRIFGEGAFNSAFVPLFGRELEENGKDAAEEFASRTFTLMMLTLGIGTAIAIPLMPWIMKVFVHGYDEEKLRITVALGRIMFGYLLCMAVGAQLSGVLNTLKIFGVPALAPVLLNIFAISGLIVAGFLYLESDLESIAATLSWAIMASGIAQLLLLFFACRHHGMRIRFVAPRWTERLKRLFILMGPGVLAAGIQQINIFIGTMIASKQDGANSWLYFADRIYQLPLGMIGIALGVVLLPDITRKLRAGDSKGANNSLNRGMEIGLLITLPAAVAMLVIPQPIISTLFERGEYTAEDSKQAAYALAAFALGLPGYVLVRVLQPGYFAREDTLRPMKMGAVTVAINTGLSFLLFEYIGHIGIAIATTVAAWANVAMLLFGLRSDFQTDQQVRSRLPRMLVASMVMGGVVFGLAYLLKPWFAQGLWVKIPALAVLVGAGMGIYGVLCLVTKAASLAELKAGFTRK
ncbi:MAG: murein biosynthesis integral membrane protein MurJ [Verrucomicrobiota bacterium]